MKLQGGHCRPISVRMSTASETRGCPTEDSNFQVRQKNHVPERKRKREREIEREWTLEAILVI